MPWIYERACYSRNRADFENLMDRTEILLALSAGPLNRANQFAPDLFIDKVDYDGSGNVLYVGIAPRGSAVSAAKWMIAKLAYDGSNRYTGSTLAGPDATWDNRATETYT